VFGNHHSLILELAAGRAEYSRGLARVYPDRNFVAVDQKGHRLRYGVRDAIENNLQNIGFLRTIIHHIDQYVAEDEVAEIWIIHPDPRPR
jgi:tRNA (guanine-N7-)-methyltransferase